MKKHLLIIILLIFTGTLFCQSKTDSALTFINKKDFKKAVDVADRLIKMDSTDQALKILINITSNDSTDKSAYDLIGDIYNGMKVYVLALQNYRQAEKLDSTDVAVKFKIASILERQQKYTDAANKYLQVIAIDSNYAKAYLKLGELLYYAKQYPNAAFYLAHYLKTNPKDYNVYLYSANSFYLMRNFAKAAEMATDGLQNFPDKTDLKKIAALSYAEMQKFDDAVKYLNTLPDSLITAEEFARIGREFQAGKQDSMAVIYYKKALAKDSTLSNLDESVANIYLTDGKYDQAIPYYEKRIKADSTSVSSFVNKALCYIELKGYNDARIALLNAVHLKNDYMPSLLWLARTYRYMDSLQTARKVYENIVQVADTNHSEYQTELSESYGFFGYLDLLKKRYKPAIEDLNTSLKYAPVSWQYHLWLAQAFALNGQKHEAIKEYKLVLSLNPKNADALKGLKLLGS